MNTAAGYDPVVGVLSAVLLAALLAMTTRRLTRSLRVFLPGARPPAGTTDYGLLVAVATVPTRDDADMLREVLAGHGIRATVAPARPGAPTPVHVLVFPVDAARARDVVATR